MKEKPGELQTGLLALFGFLKHLLLLSMHDIIVKNIICWCHDD